MIKTILCKLFTFNFENPLKTYWKVKQLVQPMDLHVYIGRWAGGLPMFRGNLGKILTIWCNDIEWKDKYNSPRSEYDPQINIVFFRKWQILIFWNKIYKGEDRSHIYWETILQYLYYNKKNLPISKICDDNNWTFWKKGLEIPILARDIVMKKWN